jgi:hypothetical protein
MADKDQQKTGDVKLPPNAKPASDEAVKRGQQSEGGAPHSPGEHQPPPPGKG